MQKLFLKLEDTLCVYADGHIYSPSDVFIIVIQHFVVIHDVKAALLLHFVPLTKQVFY